MAVPKKTTTRTTIKKVELDRNMLVPVMNNTTSRVIYQSRKTGAEFVWTEYGQVDEIELQELVQMRNVHPRYLRDPWLIVLDEEVVQYLGLGDLYENIMTPDELEGFLNLPVDKFEDAVQQMPYGMKQLVISTVMERLQNGTFDSMSKVRFLEKTYGIELTAE